MISQCRGIALDGVVQRWLGVWWLMTDFILSVHPKAKVGWFDALWKEDSRGVSFTVIYDVCLSSCARVCCVARMFDPFLRKCFRVPEAYIIASQYKINMGCCVTNLQFSLVMKICTTNTSSVATLWQHFWVNHHTWNISSWISWDPSYSL
jgi:hypothetical protein